MTWFKEESLKQMYKCIQKGVVNTKIGDLRVLCISYVLVIQNARKF